MGKPKVLPIKDSTKAKKTKETTVKITDNKKERKKPIAKATRKVSTKSAPTTMKVEDLLSCRVVGLEPLNELARKYRGKLNLQLKCTSKEHTTLNVVLNHKLVLWELELNRICRKDPVIAVENFVDDEVPPAYFTYVRENIVSTKCGRELLDPSFLVGCECERCSHTTCPCPSNSMSKFAYDRSKRVLLPPRSPIYECNQNCKCSMDCPNRVIQKGLTTRVCIFRTDNGRGWGLKTREFIPKNKFVVEYVGEIITSDEAEHRGKLYDSKQQTYLFDLDFHDEDATFTVDAYHYGNVSHFINHCCDPNLQVYSVWVDTLDPRLPRIGLFATRDIQPGEELSFDYMMTCEGQKASNSPGMRKKNNKNKKAESEANNVERHFCACGAKNCRKYLF